MITLNYVSSRKAKPGKEIGGVWFFSFKRPSHIISVVGKRREEEQKNRPEAQTKDRRLAIVWPYVSIMRR